MRYPVTLTPDDNGSVVVTFPDVPEAITYGDTVEEALARAPDALLTIFDAFIKDRRDIPESSAIHGPSIELPALETAKIELYRTLRAQHLKKTDLAKRLNWHLPQVDRILDVHHASRLDQLEAAARAMGKCLVVTIEDPGYRIGGLAKRAGLPSRARAPLSRRRVHAKAGAKR